MKTALHKLLNRLDDIARDHDDVGDTDVREQMFEAVYHGFIVQTPGYELPATFGMFEPHGDAAVREALSEFIAAARGLNLPTAEERFAAFQDPSVRSDASTPYDEYFCHSTSLEELRAAVNRSSLPVTPAAPRKWWQVWKT
jgi:hypothetical protein